MLRALWAITGKNYRGGESVGGGSAGGGIGGGSSWRTSTGEKFGGG